DVLVCHHARGRGGDIDRRQHCVQGEGDVNEGHIAGVVDGFEMLGVRTIPRVVQRQVGGEAESTIAAELHRGVAATVQCRLQGCHAGTNVRDLAGYRDVLVGYQAGGRGGYSDRGRRRVRQHDLAVSAHFHVETDQVRVDDVDGVAAAVDHAIARDLEFAPGRIHGADQVQRGVARDFDFFVRGPVLEKGDSGVGAAGSG